MIAVIAKVALKPGMMAEFLASNHEMILPTKKEEGCLSYQVFQDMQDPEVCYVIEKWESEAALQKHMASSPHFKKYMALFPGMIDKRPEVFKGTLLI